MDPFQEPLNRQITPNNIRGLLSYRNTVVPIGSVVTRLKGVCTCNASSETDLETGVQIQQASRIFKWGEIHTGHFTVYPPHTRHIHRQGELKSRLAIPWLLGDYPITYAHVQRVKTYLLIDRSWIF